MNMAPPDCEAQDQPVDPDLAWTHWALATLAEVVDIHLRTARMTAMEQQATPILRPKPDFALAQVRLARSVRLSIAMSQRVREIYREGKAGKAERKPAEDAVAEPVVPAEAAPADAAPSAAPKDGDPPEPRESLTESECLEAEREPGEAAEERRDLDAALQPRDWDGAAGVERPDHLPPEPEPAPDAPAEAIATRPEPDWPWLPDKSDTGRPVPTLPKPDSS